MRGEAKIDAAGRFLHFQFDDNATVEDWKEAQAVFLQLSGQTGIRKALVDIRRQKARGAEADLFDFGARIPNGIAFAVLTVRVRDDHRFVEDVALNRGKNVRLFFGSEEEALRWLDEA
jgi:hypothetical protein